MTLKIEIPPDFKPSKVKIKTSNIPEVMYWVYPQNSIGKKYGEASAEETYQWTKSLFKEFPLEDSSKLGLMVMKSTVIDMCLSVAIFQHRNLFGGPELWDTFEEWQRINNLKTEDEKKE